MMRDATTELARRLELQAAQQRCSQVQSKFFGSESECVVVLQV